MDGMNQNQAMSIKQQSTESLKHNYMNSKGIIVLKVEKKERGVNYWI